VRKNGTTRETDISAIVLPLTTEKITIAVMELALAMLLGSHPVTNVFIALGVDEGALPVCKASGNGQPKS